MLFAFSDRSATKSSKGTLWMKNSRILIKKGVGCQECVLKILKFCQKVPKIGKYFHAKMISYMRSFLISVVPRVFWAYR